MLRKWQKWLWLLAGVVAVALVVMTVRLATRSRNLALVNQTVYLAEQRGAVGLREGPDPASPVVAALVRGSAVTILEVTIERGQTWILVQKANTVPGWIPLEAVTRDPP